MTRYQNMRNKLIIRLLVVVIFLIGVLPELGMSGATVNPNSDLIPTHAIGDTDGRGEISVFICVGFEREPYRSLYNNPDAPFTFHFKVFDVANPDQFLSFIKDPGAYNTWVYVDEPAQSEALFGQVATTEIPIVNVEDNEEAEKVVLRGLPIGIAYQIVQCTQRMIPFDPTDIDICWWQLSPKWGPTIPYPGLDYDPRDVYQGPMLMPRDGQLQVEILNSVMAELLSTPGKRVTYAGNGYKGPLPQDDGMYPEGFPVYVLGPADSWHPNYNWTMEYPGYEFICWNTKADGTGVDYYPTDFYWAAALQSQAGWQAYLDAHLPMPNENITLYAQWKPTSNQSDPDPPWENSFADVDKDAWYYNDVAFAAQRGIMNGEGDSSFHPLNVLTRAMVVQVFYNMAGRPDVSQVPNPFTDVPNNAWYVSCIKWAHQTGLASGIGDGRFAPDDFITREQLTLMLSNYQNATGSIPPNIVQKVQFTDHTLISSWARDAVTTLYMQGLINGKPINRFDPHGEATRAEFAAIMHRYLDAVA